MSEQFDPRSANSVPYGFDPAAGGLTMDDLAGVRGTSTDDPSGFSLAEQAHEAGAVTAPAELPTFTVALELRIHAGKLEAETLAYAIADTLSGHPLIVPPVALSIQVREQ